MPANAAATCACHALNCSLYRLECGAAGSHPHIVLRLAQLPTECSHPESGLHQLNPPGSTQSAPHTPLHHTAGQFYSPKRKLNNAGLSFPAAVSNSSTRQWVACRCRRHACNLDHLHSCAQGVGTPEGSNCVSTLHTQVCPPSNLANYLKTNTNASSTLQCSSVDPQPHCTSYGSSSHALARYNTEHPADAHMQRRLCISSQLLHATQCRH